MAVTVDKILGILRERDTASDSSNPSDLSNYYTKGEVDNLFKEFGTDATQSASGLMSAADKAKLDEIAAVPSRPGYFKLPSGLLVQWGATADLSSDGETAVTLPLSFTREPLVVFATTTVSGIIASGLFNGLSEIRLYSSGYKSTPFKIYWLAIGK